MITNMSPHRKYSFNICQNYLRNLNKLCYFFYTIKEIIFGDLGVETIIVNNNNKN